MLIVRAVAEAIFSGPSGPPPAERIDWLCRDFDDLMRKAGPNARTVIRVFSQVISALAPAMIGRPPGLWRLSLPDRVRALRKLEASFASGALLAVRALICILYYEHPDAAREVGFVGEGAMGPTPERVA